MGSGETSPTMVTPHQELLRGSASSRAKVVLDTPFGFQENADDLALRLVSYFENSVGVQTSVSSLRGKAESPAQVARTIDSIRDADWLFAGPGSPSYALGVWQHFGLGAHFDDLLSRGTIVLASAAALTAGSHTMPVYEIYKVGQPPVWLPGLNLLERHTGLSAAVVPHFDNAEGAGHDTRYCYVGERRIRELEAQLPAQTFILGVDEHTGVRFDLENQEAHVFGRGAMTIRHGDSSWIVPSGKSATFAQIAERAESSLVSIEPAALYPPAIAQVSELLDEGQVTAAVDALLELDELDRDVETRATVHALITRLGAIAANPRLEVADVVGPYIEMLLQARQAARASGRWDEADAIRSRLTELRVTIKDSGSDSTWEIQQ